MKTRVFGLRDVGPLKVYCKTGNRQFYVGERIAGGLRRVRLRGEAEALALAALPQVAFVSACRERLDAAKRVGSEDYFEAAAVSYKSRSVNVRIREGAVVRPWRQS